MPKIRVNDIEMYYESQGEGHPLLVIWGIGGEIPPLAECLVRGGDGKFTVITFDNRGTGRTDKPDVPYSVEMMADDTVGLLNALGISSAHILGISTGARVAIVLAAKHPNRVARLALHVAAVRSPEREDPGANAAFERLRVTMTHPGFMEKALAHPPTIATFLRQFDALREFDGQPLLEQIRIPTLVVNCTRDASTPVRYAEELASGIVGARLILLDGDHLVARTDPKSVVVPVLAFFLEGSDREPMTTNVMNHETRRDANSRKAK